MLPGFEITMNSLSLSMWSTRIEPTVMGGSCLCTVLLSVSVESGSAVASLTLACHHLLE